jgi:hypothetical protein
MSFQRMHTTPISRRDFLKLAGLNLGACLLPLQALSTVPYGSWPALAAEELPAAINEILEITPETSIDDAGLLNLTDRRSQATGQVHLARTRWNLQHSTPSDRLASDVPWGIVLHWFGDLESKNLDLDGYLRGFNGRRREDDTLITTSAHFLVGDGQPTIYPPKDEIGIIQTQKADRDGVPFQAAHVRGLSMEPHDEKKQYFVRAYDQLARQDSTIRSLLQDLYATQNSPWYHPNQRTIAIEITGADFDDDFPTKPKIANVLSVVWALMKRYNILASRVLGHHEIQMNKGDPGKQFMALIRFLIGVKALVQPDPLMKLLVFGQHIGPDGDMEQAVKRYFKLIRDYHVLITKPKQVYAWEALSQYWNIYPLVNRNVAALKAAATFSVPIAGALIKNGYSFLNPENHEGIDLHHPFQKGTNRPEKPAEVQLVAQGECLYLGQVNDCHAGRLAIFCHQQPDAAQVLSVYGHLTELGRLKVGQHYPIGTPIGVVDNVSVSCGRFLHFAIAYGAAWDLDLRSQPNIPLGAGVVWIRERYLDPLKYLEEHV